MIKIGTKVGVCGTAPALDPERRAAQLMINLAPAAASYAYLVFASIEHQGSQRVTGPESLLPGTADQFLGSIDCLVVEVSFPGVMVGLLMGQALARGKRVLCVHTAGWPALPWPVDVLDGLTVQRYEDDDALRMILKEFLQGAG